MEAPFVCQNCGKGFRWPHTMTRHRKKCVGIFMYSCRLCGKPFHRRDAYIEHLKGKHKVFDEPKVNHSAGFID
jgi:KRAB domain-containing zinc finger protein